jgi:hypothetical protein
LVPTTGPQPTVAEENAHPGTTAWRLPGPAADVGGLASRWVTGYVAEQALGPGQTERIYVSAPGARRVRIRVYRMGWYGGTGGRDCLFVVQATRPQSLLAQLPTATYEAYNGWGATAYTPEVRTGSG